MILSCGHQVGAVVWELSQGLGQVTLVLSMSLSMGLLGIPHSVVVGFQEQVSQESQVEGTFIDSYDPAFKVIQ